MVSILVFWLFLSNSTLPVTPEKFLVVARVSRIDCASLAPRCQSAWRSSRRRDVVGRRELGEAERVAADAI
jgi:hypothetical protein